MAGVVSLVKVSRVSRFPDLKFEVVMINGVGPQYSAYGQHWHAIFGERKYHLGEAAVSESAQCQQISPPQPVPWFKHTRGKYSPSCLGGAEKGLRETGPERRGSGWPCYYESTNIVYTVVPPRQAPMLLFELTRLPKIFPTCRAW